MSRQNISRATELFVGRVTKPNYQDNKPGIQFDPLKWHDFGAPAVGDADGLINDATGTELPNTETVTYTFPAANVSPTDEALRLGVLDVPRNVVAVVTHGSSVVAMTILVTGLDVYDVEMSELLTITATGTSKTANGLKAFKEITSVAITAAADAEANTLNLGTGDVLGLPFRVDANDLIQARFDNLVDIAVFVPAVTTDPATTTTGDVRGTINPNGTLDGTKKLGALFKVAGWTTEEEAYGVTQA